MTSKQLPKRIILPHGYHFTRDWIRLRKITEPCRDDMHEPDEQEVKAIVRGNYLDNAMGADPEHNCGELTVGIKRGGKKTEWFNLASLIAMARCNCPAD